MALWSLFIEVDTKSYSTQLQAATPREAVASYLSGESLSEFLRSEHLGEWPSRLSATDIVLFVPMEGLTNMYLCQLGRDGKYVSIILVCTVENTNL